MNLLETIEIAERGKEFINYMRDFYSLEHDGLYADEYQFTDAEIVEGINQYFKGELNLKGVLQYGVDSTDRECVRDIILFMRG